MLTDDTFALIEHLGLTHYDLGGYSLGGRTVTRALVRGATPDRGLSSLVRGPASTAELEAAIVGELSNAGSAGR